MSGLVDKIKGKLKQIEGKLTGDKVREAQGTVEETKGDVEIAAGRAADKVKDGVDSLKVKAREVKNAVSAKVSNIADRAEIAARRRANRKRARGY